MGPVDSAQLQDLASVSPGSKSLTCLNPGVQLDVFLWPMRKRHPSIIVSNDSMGEALFGNTPSHLVSLEI